VLSELTAELALVMVQLGVSRLDVLRPDLLASGGAAGRLERPEAG
jgi:hypothetical protein